MPGWTSLHRMMLAALMAGALGFAAPASADGIIQSLFNSGGNSSSAKPLFLGGSNATSPDDQSKVFDLNGDGNSSGNRPSVAGFGAATQARNDAIKRAEVARTALDAANELAQTKAANKKREDERRAATASQKHQMAASQTAAATAARAAANRAAASAPAPGEMSTPAATEDAPLYNTPGQANTGQAPIFGIH